jgi:hypothetical protein
MAMLRLDGWTPFTTRSLILMSPLVMPSSPAIMFSKRGLAAARRADEHEEFALLHGDVDLMQHLDGAVGLGDVVDVEKTHGQFILSRSREFSYAMRAAHEVAPGHDVDEQRGRGRHDRAGEMHVVFRTPVES